MRHALGVLGVLAAGVLLAVSCAMNWRFGVSLGRTELDGQIYGAAGALNFDYAGDNRVTWSITDGWIGGGKPTRSAS